MLRRDFAAFCSSVTEHWKQLVGGSLIAIVLSIACTMGLNIPREITGIAAFCILVVYAAFLAWRDEHRKVQEIAARGFRGHIFQVGIGESKVIGSNISGVGITVLLKVTNSGPPSILEGFVATVRCKAWKRNCPPVYLPPNNHKFTSENGQEVAIEPSEMLYDKTTAAPIPEGGRVAGFLFYFLKDVAYDQLRADWPEITVHFQDASGTDYNVTSGSDSHEEVQLRVAGVKDPFSAFPRRRNTEGEPVGTGHSDARLWHIREDLAPQLAKGVQLKSKCGRFGRAPIDHKTLSAEAHEWANDVVDYLTTKVGRMAVVQFENAPFPGATTNPGIGWDNFMFISARVAGLQNILTKLPDYIMPL